MIKKQKFISKSMQCVDTQLHIVSVVYVAPDLEVIDIELGQNFLTVPSNPDVEP